MQLARIPAEELEIMDKKGFIELMPYAHKSKIVRWLFWKRLKTILELAEPAERVLDFGAGSGIFMPTLSKNFKEVYSLDLNTNSLEYVKNKYELENVKIVKGRGEKLPFKDEFFDIIFAADVLEHLKDSKKVQGEFKRVLKKNGWLIISGPTESSLYKLARKILYKREIPPDHYTDIYDIISKSRSLFEIEKMKTLPSRIVPAFKIYKARKV